MVCPPVIVTTRGHSSRWARSGTSAPRIQRQAQSCSKPFGSVQTLNSGCDGMGGSMWRSVRQYGDVGARRLVPQPVILAARFHDLRHTAASLWLAAGADPKVVQWVLGHATAAMTMDLYRHLVDAGLRQAARLIGAPRGHLSDYRGAFERNPSRGRDAKYP